MLSKEIETLKINNLSFKIMEINVNQKINAEEWVKKHYSSLGFKIDLLRNYVKSNLMILPRKLIRIRYDELAGIPDFLVFREMKGEEICDFFFIEVKTDEDGLSYNQMRWIKNHPNIPVLVLHVKQNIVKNTKK